MSALQHKPANVTHIRERAYLFSDCSLVINNPSQPQLCAHREFFIACQVKGLPLVFVPIVLLLLLLFK